MTLIMEPSGEKDHVIILIRQMIKKDLQGFQRMLGEGDQEGT